ncbi:uncharacterized protein LOC129357667 [Poeciliopsis prolifica]|uniref:uncharacterized protein LOC129357667 n=1 Tax=Poeciliopsis prolifica TaxID=188132 RepID=UPI002413D30F|nr:uncharacterized protein LOC129357667 [Poeciliopsis prolifica]
MGWPADLLKKGKKITTVKRNSTRGLQVTKRGLVSVARALKSAASQISTTVVLHQIQVKDDKERRTVTPELLRRCLERCRTCIPVLLRDLSRRKRDVNLRNQLIGYFGLYVASLYGHRTGVVSNMRVSEVEEAEQSGSRHDSSGYVINVRHHKTNRAFGSAQLFLTPEEYGWLRRWMAIRRELRPDSDLMFFNLNGGPVNKLTSFARDAWARMRLPGSPSLTDIRTAARNTQCAEVRQRMSQLMCHDTRTADRFYAMQLTVSQLADMRRTFDLSREADQQPLE